MKAYKEVHRGPVDDVYYRYAESLNIMFIAFTYGLGIPVLFLWGALYFLMQWFCFRFMYARYYRIPNHLSEKLPNMFMSIAYYAPSLFILNGFWMIGNTQIIANEWNQIYNGHVFWYFFADRS